MGLSQVSRSRGRAVIGPALAALAGLSAGPASAASADFILIEKAARRMTLYDGGRPIATYRIALGFAPVGDKTRAGDGRTPEGAYRIDYKNPASQFHLSLRISYPNAEDRAAARAAGRDPGGDIFVHGTPGRIGPPRADETIADWTLGCVAVSNSEIEEIWRLVAVGTPVEIRP
jgi:murein L,D-transpeptidase YafK